MPEPHPVLVSDLEAKMEPSHHSLEHAENAPVSDKLPWTAEEEMDVSIDERLEKKIRIMRYNHHHVPIERPHQLTNTPPTRRKLDLRLVPILAAIYTMALVDRTNLGSARIAGLDEATGLDVGNRASITSKHPAFPAGLPSFSETPMGF